MYPMQKKDIKNQAGKKWKRQSQAKSIVETVKCEMDI